MKTKPGRAVYKVLFSVVVLFIIAGIIATYFYKDSLKPVAAKDTTNINIEVPAGSSNKGIGKILSENKLIKNELIFLIRVKATENTGNLKAGEYSLSPSMNVNEIIDLLVKGGKSGETVKFTIPEGYEIEEVAERLEQDGIVNKADFLNLASNKNNFEEDFDFLKVLDDGQSLEGFLFPSTYEVYKYDDEKSIIQKMLGEFKKIYHKDIEKNLESSSLNLNEIITLASIVEREAKLDEERSTIAAVFLNRLETDMNLGSCATVQYILGERKERLTNKETNIDSPFNTYINSGLPPAPIASPGEKSIIATLNPDDVDYLYFVLTEDNGGHTFTKTYEEHLKASEKNK